MNKHTEGPWFVAEDEAADCLAHKNSGLAMVDTGRAADWPIARLCEWNNARLIAAAPDLLEALKLAMQYGKFDPLSHQTVIRAGRAAIAKAEGVTQ